MASNHSPSFVKMVNSNVCVSKVIDSVRATNVYFYTDLVVLSVLCSSWFDQLLLQEWTISVCSPTHRMQVQWEYHQDGDERILIIKALCASLALYFSSTRIFCCRSPAFKDGCLFLSFGPSSFSLSFSAALVVTHPLVIYRRALCGAVWRVPWM